MTDVIVIGAGPSGLNTARLLAESGVQVLVLEKKAEVGLDVVCSGVVGKNVFAEFRLPDSSTIQDIRRVELVSPYRTVVSYSHPKPFACVVDRGRFDRNLADLAVRAGAEILCGHEVRGIRVSDGRVNIKADSTEKTRIFQARVAVLATGVNGGLPGRVGLGIAREFLYGVQAEVPSDSRDLTRLYVGNSIAPGAFAWAVPAGQNIRIGMVAEKVPRDLFQRFLVGYFPASLTDIALKSARYKKIVQGAGIRTSGERILAVGEAAGHVKTTTGGGIYFGLIGSRSAAEVILKGLRRNTLDSRFMSEYEKSWKQSFLKEILVGYFARKVYAKLSDAQVERLFRLAQTNGILPYVKENGNFDWHSGLILGLAKKAPFFSSIL